MLKLNYYPKLRRFGHIIIFVLSSVTVLKATECLSDMPQAALQDDAYLEGVKEIILWAYMPLDTKRIPEQHTLLSQEALKPENVYRIAEKTLRDTLTKRVIDVVPIRSVMSDKIEISQIPEDSLVIELVFSYEMREMNNQNVIVGAFYPLLKRKLPESFDSPRISGYHPVLTGLQAPALFIIPNAAPVSGRDFETAIQKSLAGVGDWINNHMSENIPDNRNQKN